MAHESDTSFDEDLKRISELVTRRATELDARWAEFSDAVEEVARLARLAGKHVVSEPCILAEGGPRDPDVEGELSVGHKAVGLWIPDPFEDDPHGIYGKWVELTDVPSDYRFILLRDEVHRSLAGNLRRALEQDGEIIARPISRTVLARSEPSVAKVAEELGWTVVAERWRRAHVRAASRPGEAITLSRTLVEDVAKHVLEHHGQPVPSELKGAVRQALGVLGDESQVNDKMRAGLQTLEQGIFSVRNHA